MKIIPNGIESCAPIVIGARILEAFIDRYKSKFTATPKQIEKVLKISIKISPKQTTIKSPGSLKKHYSPGIPIYMNKKKCPGKYAFITFGKKYPVTRNSFNLSKKLKLG